MSKKSKSKNSIVKKAKKFQRQGKFEKAIKLCDDYLDNEKLEESIIQIKVDNLSQYSIKLTYDDDCICFTEFLYN